MIRLILGITGLITVSVLILAIKADPHLWASTLTLLDHNARGAGEDLNARLGTWITPTGTATP